MDSIKKYSNLEHVENNPRNLSINSDEFSKVNTIVKEIYNCVALKIVDDIGIESLKIVEL